MNKIYTVETNKERLLVVSEMRNQDVVWHGSSIKPDQTYGIITGGDVRGRPSNKVTQDWENIWKPSPKYLEQRYAELMKKGGVLAEILPGIKKDYSRKVLGYILANAPYFVAEFQALSPTGCLILPVSDLTDNAATKTVNQIFGVEHPRRMFCRVWAGGDSHSTNIPNKFQIIRVWTKTDDFNFNPEESRVDYDSEYESSSCPGRRKKYVRNPDGKLRSNVIYAIRPYPHKKDDGKKVDKKRTEKWWYKNQQPEKVCGILIGSYAPKDGSVLIPFCGGGTELVAAQRQGRNWTGLNNDIRATLMVEQRLFAEFGKVDYFSWR